MRVVHSRRVTDLEPALFHFRPSAAEMTRVERNAQAGQRFFRPGRRQRLGRSPEPRDLSPRGFVIGKAQREESLRVAVLENLRRIIVDLEQVVAQPVRAVDIPDEVRELVVGDCLLIVFEDAPPRLTGENGEVVGCIEREGKDPEKK